MKKSMWISTYIIISKYSIYKSVRRAWNEDGYDWMLSKSCLYCSPPASSFSRVFQSLVCMHFITCGIPSSFEFRLACAFFLSVARLFRPLRFDKPKQETESNVYFRYIFVYLSYIWCVPQLMIRFSHIISVPKLLLFFSSSIEPNVECVNMANLACLIQSYRFSMTYSLHV